MDHCAVNVALYDVGRQRWAMTERRRAAVSRGSDTLAIGRSHLEWRDDRLTVAFDEAATPGLGRLRGEVRLDPLFLNQQAFDLDGEGRHVWRPIAPRSRVEVRLEGGGDGWTGDGYLDANFGAEPLEQAFDGWHWSRVHLARDTLIFYDVERRTGEQAHLALRFGADGRLDRFDPPPRVRLPTTSWGIGRIARGDDESAPVVRRTLEDTPFYARSAIDGGFGREAGRTVHESLSLTRLRSPVVKALLPFRMPRTLW